MKKLCSIVLTVAMLVGMVSMGGFTVSAATYRAGDVNMDGAITSEDARALLNLIVNETVLSAEQATAADANADGRVNTTDVKRILYLVSQGTQATTQTIDLLPALASDWHNPVQYAAGAHAAVGVTENTSGAQIFTNYGGIWPYSAYVYDDKLLVPTDATIEYDLTVGTNATSICIYTGGSIPDLDGDATTDAVAKRSYFKLNSLISSTNIEAGSGDLTKGTYKGTIKMSDVDYDKNSLIDGMVWISGIKVYSVGANGTAVTIRKLQTKGMVDPFNEQTSTDPLESVRTQLIDDTEATGLGDLTALELYENGVRVDSTALSTSKDNKKIYSTQLKQRVVNYPDGFQLDVPFDWKEDFSLSAFRTRFTSEDYTLSVTKETQSPYGNTESGWNTYLNEWLKLYIGNSSFLSANDLSYARTGLNTTTMLSGYQVLTYDITINNPGATAQPYYSIAIIRKTTVYNRFFVMVLKSTGPTVPVIDSLIRSFKEVTSFGTFVNSVGQYKATPSAKWNAETKAYYEKLCTQDTTDFGFFSASMVPSGDGSYTSQNNKIKSEYNRISTALDYEYAIMPTYTHLKTSGKANAFPSTMATTYAGGNGFNGKPVLQFTYQFTTSNNSSLAGHTPMFDIMRGSYDSQFKTLATAIKNYGKPVIFRLNNEMNTDWTSYCGLVTLLDPDIYVATWRRLYNIFEQQGVDNCIWVFNPAGTTTPYCDWGDELCYMPGAEYMHILGLTAYEMGNGTSLQSFRTLYSSLHNQYKSYFNEYPWMISEFACGAGGQKLYDWGTDSYTNTVLGRNADKQATWVKDMFMALNNRDLTAHSYCSNIKGAVWFSTNDLVKISGTNYITNYLVLDDSLTATLQAFKEGLAASTATE